MCVPGCSFGGITNFTNINTKKLLPLMLTNSPRQIFFSLYELRDSIIHEPIRDGFSCRLFLYLHWVIMLRSLHVCMTVGGRIRLVYLISSLVSLPQIVCWNPFISTSSSFAQVAARHVRAAATGSRKIRWRHVTHHMQTLQRQRGRCRCTHPFAETVNQPVSHRGSEYVA